MAYFKIDQTLIDAVTRELRERGCEFSPGEVNAILAEVKQGAFFGYVEGLINHIESILDIDPSLSEREILQKVARNVAEFLGAALATVRIYDPASGKMLAFGSYPNLEATRQEAIPFEDSVAGEVVRTRRSYFVPDISREEKYKDGGHKMMDQGIHSLMAVPISLPRFSLKDVDSDGVLQVYFTEAGKVFTPLEAKIAETFSKRVSYVIARKRIVDLQELNTIKDKIVEQIFLKLGNREGIKMRDVFNLVIPELADIIKIQRCALFIVQDDRRTVMLEAGFPEEEHGIGKIFSVDLPYIDAIVNQRGPFGEFENEKIYPNYILIHDPQESRLIPPDLKTFLRNRQINSVFYIPLKVGNLVKYFLVFDAQSHHRRFTDKEIEIFTFLGKELMKGLRMEKMDDILHDFKNPAIAVAGFARRVQRMLAEGGYLSRKERIDEALEIIRRETTRIQDLAMALYEEERKELIDLTEILKRRYIINAEAIGEMYRENIRMEMKELASPLCIRASPILVERVLDNLLHNASKAIPEEGGRLSIQSYPRGQWAVAEIANTGWISEEERGRYLQGEGRGRGLHITRRLVNQMGGKMELDTRDGEIVFRVMYPLVKET